MINYQITPRINSHIYHIKLSFIAEEVKCQLKLPTWIPGSYMIREFSKNIININAKQNNKPVLCQQINKNTWQLNQLIINTMTTVEYTVYAYDFGIRTAYLDHKRGYFNNTSLCLYVVGQESVEHTISFNDLPENWKVATGLAYNKQNNQFVAENYNQLIDCPFELGDFLTLNFKVKNVPHKVIISGILLANFDQARLLADLEQLCNCQIDLFGGIAPFNHYTFLLHLGGELFTGLEHSNSTALLAPYRSLPLTNFEKQHEDYFKLLGLISHEYFHLWNVKRIKPQVFNPHGLEQENYTILLWWFEGITSYYDDLLLYRARLISQKEYLQAVLNNINNVYKFTGVLEQTLTNSSLTSWIKYYRQDENSPNSMVSYYTKGSLVGLCLDLLIRSNTQNTYSLDNVMLGLYQKWQNDNLGLNESESVGLIYEFTGCDLTTQLDRFINSCETLPLVELLDQFGITLHYLAASNYDDNGKVIASKDELPKESLLNLGCKLIKDNLGYKVINVYNNTAAQKAELAANDILLAIDGVKLSNLEQMLKLYKIGDKISLTLFRREQLLNLDLTLEALPAKIVYLEIHNQERLNYWLCNKN